MTPIDTTLLLKLGISAILGLIIGLERELKRKPVGLKTSLVICIVSCLLTIVSIEAAYVSPKSDHVNITMDPLRLAAQIVSGIGFLGAGVILRKGNDSISGLTTAAMIWGAAGIGIAVGAGFYWEATVGVILLIFSVEVVPVIITYLGPRRLREKELSLKATIEQKKEIKSIIEQIKSEEITIENIRIKDLKNDLHLLELKIIVDFRKKTVDLYYTISDIPGIIDVEIESL
ncbi:MgtC/SapB family protein [Rossellomorea marisflavi]|jgi:putative Mg2+ transporter-C (MgtC) family protein|uniref:MgtC/SapB family protein n=1 Tax=Rossellomorea marisflavi TaxID=189381 RepID=UPI0028532858|nr:MgtC/SapB family protein [Rossellomorea marisflavi]MDR4935807.1 MgtC/SapB family protein [Rossellomorea marisflavi]